METLTSKFNKLQRLTKNAYILLADEKMSTSELIKLEGDIANVNEEYSNEWQTIFDSTTDEETHKILEDWKKKALTTVNQILDMIHQRIDNPPKVATNAPEPILQRTRLVQGAPGNVTTTSIQGAPSTSTPVQGNQHTNTGTPAPRQCGKRYTNHLWYRCLALYFICIESGRFCLSRFESGRTR